jgi:hypothetical protein
MNNWSNAIIVCIVLVAATWLLVVNAGSPPVEPPKPEPKPPGPAPVEQPVEQVDAVGNPIQMYRDVKKLVAFAGQVQKAIEAASRELAVVNLRETEPEAQPAVEPVQWTPPHRQAVVYFYSADRHPVHGDANALLRQGHTIYRVGPHRREIWRQYEVDRIPTWLVIRDGRVIYRSSVAPVFPEPQIEPVSRPQAQAPVYSPPVYRSVPTYRSYQNCYGGVCR